MNLILLGAALSRPPDLDTLPPLAAAGIVIARMVRDIRRDIRRDDTLPPLAAAGTVIARMVRDICRDIRRDVRPCYVPRHRPGDCTPDLGEYLGESRADSDAGVRSRGDLHAAPAPRHTVRADLPNSYFSKELRIDRLLPAARILHFHH